MSEIRMMHPGNKVEAPAAAPKHNYPALSERSTSDREQNDEDGRDAPVQPLSPWRNGGWSAAEEIENDHKIKAAAMMDKALNGHGGEEKGIKGNKSESKKDFFQLGFCSFTHPSA